MITKAQANEHVTVIELFTSQGCGDVAPAEAAFNDLVQEHASEIVAFSCPVTLFDQIGWKDPFSQKICDRRLDDYVAANISTTSAIPQVILNGTFTSTTPRPNILSAMVKMSKVHSDIKPIDLGLKDGALQITLPEVETKKPLMIWLIGYQDDNESLITAGPNEGALLQQARIARVIQRLGPWNGKTAQQSYALANTSGAINGYIILAQEQKDQGDFEQSTMRIFAAGQVRSDQDQVGN